MEQYYEHPKGYRPNKKKLVNGVFITGMARPEVHGFRRP